MTSALVVERRVVLPSLLLATAIPSIIVAAAAGFGTRFARLVIDVVAIFDCFCYAAAIIDYCLIDLIIVVCIWPSLERLAMLKMVCTVVAKERGNRLQYAICGVGQIYLDSDKAMSISMVDGVDS
jgi:hypothetical protein